MNIVRIGCPFCNCRYTQFELNGIAKVTLKQSTTRAIRWECLHSNLYLSIRLCSFTWKHSPVRDEWTLNEARTFRNYILILLTAFNIFIGSYVSRLPLQMRKELAALHGSIKYPELWTGSRISRWQGTSSANTCTHESYVKCSHTDLFCLWLERMNDRIDEGPWGDYRYNKCSNEHRTRNCQSVEMELSNSAGCSNCASISQVSAIDRCALCARMSNRPAYYSHCNERSSPLHHVWVVYCT